MDNERWLVRVIKVGGSLYRLADLPARLHAWLEQQQPATNLLVAGGGRLVDEIREVQQLWGYSDEAAHELALRCMDLNARQLAAALPQLQLQRQWHPEVEIVPEQSAVLECGEWAARHGTFERSWRTTSDSIAAEIAGCVGAQELVLLKSSLPQNANNPGEYVDPLFLRHLPRQCKLRLVNLALSGFPEGDWLES